MFVKSLNSNWSFIIYNFFFNQIVLFLKNFLLFSITLTFPLCYQVIVAAELLKNADELVKQKIHPTSIISGYRLACKYVNNNQLKMF